MWKLLKNAWRVDEVRKKLIFTFLMLIVIRIGSIIPIPESTPTILTCFLPI